MAGAKSRAPTSPKSPARKKKASSTVAPGKRTPAASRAAGAKSRAKPKSKPLATSKPAGRAGKASPRKASAAAATAKAPKSAVNAPLLGGLHQVALLASDLDTAVDFYRNVLGISFMDRFDPPGLAFFDLGGGLRLLLSATASEATLYFAVTDMKKAVRTLSQRGVSFLQKPAMVHRDDEGRLGKKGVEEWMAFFRDPSGNLLALVARQA